MEPVFAIVNPASANGSTARFWPKARRVLEDAGVVLEAVLTEGPGHATALARTAGLEGRKTVLYVGGDGTANEVANGLLETPSCARPRLAALPRGTGGDFPKSMGMAAGPEAAAARLLHGSERTIDVVVSTFVALDGSTTRRHFINIADAGLGGYVAERVNRTSKVFGGFASFLYSTVSTFWNLENHEMAVTVDGVEVFAGRAATVAVCNGPRFGGGMLMSPDAKLDDGLLDIVVIGDMSKADLLISLRRLYNGTIFSHPKTHLHQGTEVRVEAQLPTPLEIDGEHPGTTPFHVWLEPLALRLVV